MSCIITPEEIQMMINLGFKICPNCRNAVERNGGCDHMSCRCGKQFCYKCGAGPFNDSNEYSAHKSAQHP